ncbi:hypothetical protein GQ359_03625 [Polynucleobacter sp. AM-7D1]|nr:hypothetical protein GQ359_03625 [Polynucleobacter sp. AM-7D1]
MKVLREFESHLFRQVNRYYKGLWQYNSLVTKIVTKAILRGGFFLGRYWLAISQKICFVMPERSCS